MLREMSLADVEAVAVLVQRALAAEDERELPEYCGSDSYAAWARRVEDDSQWALLRVEGSTVVGVCHGAPEWDFERNEPVPGVAHLTGLFVEPEEWGRGYGRALVRAACDVMRARGFRKARLWVAVGNERARRLYSSEGWRETGRAGTASDGRELVEYEAAL
ncbi:MAG: GNAT family N-acetyltransferase [Candidatus Methylomirabilaceae bacterium]